MPFQTPIIARIPSTNSPDCGVLNVHLPWASRCQLPPMVKVAQRIKEHFEQIVTCLTHRTRSLIFCGKLKIFLEALRE